MKLTTLIYEQSQHLTPEERLCADVVRRSFDDYKRGYGDSFVSADAFFFGSPEDSTLDLLLASLPVDSDIVRERALAFLRQRYRGFARASADEQLRWFAGVAARLRSADIARRASERARVRLKSENEKLRAQLRARKKRGKKPRQVASGEETLASTPPDGCRPPRDMTDRESRARV